MIHHYSLPINLASLMRGQTELKKCDLPSSVRQHIFMILLSKPGEYRYDRAYGSPIWEFDFDYLQSIQKAKANLERALKAIIEQQEPRLGEVTVKINFGSKEFKKNRFSENRQVKKEVAVYVQGTLLETNQPFKPAPYVIYISPVTV